MNFRHIYIYITKIVQMKIVYLFKKMRTSSLIILLVQQCLCVSISRGKPSIYSLVNIGYDVYVVSFISVVYVVYVVYAVYVVYVVYVVLVVYVVAVVYVVYVVNVVYVVKPNIFYVINSDYVIIKDKEYL